MEKKNSKIYKVKYPSYITLANPSSKFMWHLQMEKVTRTFWGESSFYLFTPTCKKTLNVVLIVLQNYFISIIVVIRD